MSHTTLYAAYEAGDLVECAEYKNSYGSAWMVWAALIEKYEIWNVKDDGSRDAWIDRPRYGSYADGMPEKLWAYEDLNGALRPFEYNALVSTYDHAVVTSEDLISLAESLEAFEMAHAIPFRVCSLGAMARDIRNVHEEGARCVAWNQTSVGEFWGTLLAHEHASKAVRSEDSCPVYNVDTMNGHWVARMISPVLGPFNRPEWDRSRWKRQRSNDPIPIGKA